MPVPVCRDCRPDVLRIGPGYFGWHPACPTCFYCGNTAVCRTVETPTGDAAEPSQAHLSRKTIPKGTKVTHVSGAPLHFRAKGTIIPL